MYSESDIDAAIAAGVLPREVATGFRNHVAAMRATPAVDEEHFRLITGFNDIFVSIAIVLLLVALSGLGSAIATPLSGILVAAAAWALALFFTARRRMALPSILLLLAFVGGVANAMFAAMPPASDRMEALMAAVIAAASGGAAWLHWRHFHVPITVAAGAAAMVGLVMALIIAAIPNAEQAIWPLLLLAGLIVFAFAMHWDLSDPQRTTRRADVAFWLHLAAAPMIAHSAFQMLGVFGDAIGTGTAVAVLALYLLFAAVALAVDRRALLVSSLIYVLYALTSLIRTTGAVEVSWALTALVIGSALLSLSVFWQPIRGLVVTRLGALGKRLPPVQLAV